MADEVPLDASLLWIRERVCALLKGTKPELFNKLVASEEDGDKLKRFTTDESYMRLFFSGGAKEMTVMETLDPKSKKKVAYIQKVKEFKMDVTKPALNSMYIVVGDLNAPLLESLLYSIKGVYLPIIQKANTKWSEVTVRDFNDRVQHTLAAVTEAIGQTKAKTILSLPPIDQNSKESKEKESKDRVHVLETAVVVWTARINCSLARSPAELFNDGQQPLPMACIDFWQMKTNDLNDLLTQLASPPVAKMLKVLDIIRSPYYTAFKTLQNQLQVAHVEAKDNLKYLLSLKPHFEGLVSAEYETIPSMVKPIMHVILMVWKHSKFYNTADCLAIIIRMVCNAVMEKSRDFLGTTDELFNLEPKEAVEKLVLVLEVTRQLKFEYFLYANMSKSQCENNPWAFDRGTMFKRHDAFLQRCEDLLHLCRTAQQFEKMSTVVIGGNTGAALTNDVEGVAKEFDKIFDKMKACGYDCLDVSEERFESDITRFTSGVKELEVRIAKVLIGGFEECGTVSSGFKLVDSFGEMLERDFILSDLETKHLELILIYADELKEVQELFTRDKNGLSSKGKFFEREGPPLYVNMPPVSGALAWVQGLIQRLEIPMRSLTPVLKLMEDTDEVKDVTRMYQSIHESLSSYEQSMFSAWDATVDTTLADKLTLPLLVRDPRSGEITVNFDPALVKLLNECKYFTLQKKDIPEVARKLFAQAEIFRVQTANLTLIQIMYNEMLKKMLDVEKPLLKAQMKAIDKVLDRGLKGLEWQSANPDKDAFIAEANALVVDAHQTLFQMKANMEAIIAILNKWIAAPLMTRASPNKTFNLAAYMEDHAKYLEARQKDVTDTGKEIHSFLKASNEVLKVSKGAPAWRAYVEYINNILVSGIADTVVASLAYLLSQIDPKLITSGGKSPFFDVKLDLNPSGKGDEAVFFSPPLDGPASAPSVMGYVQSIISDFYNVVKFIKRLDRAEGDFLKEMEENESVRFHVHRIVDECEINRAKCVEYKQPFLKHRSLWAKDIDGSLTTFLEEEGGMETIAGSEEGVEIQQPSLPTFQKRVNELKSEESEIKEIESSILEGWLKIDAKPIKTALGVTAAKWSATYTAYLKNHVESELSNLEEFISRVSAGLATEVEENDQEKLIQAMTYVRDVRVNTERYDSLFQPLKETIVLLKKFAIAMPDETVELLEMIPFKWEDTKKVTVNAREMLGPLQSLQQDKVREYTEEFRSRVLEMAKEFHAEAPFKYDVGVDSAYKQIQHYHKTLVGLEEEGERVNQQQELFEVAVVNWRDLKTCRTELTQLKLVWDHVQLVLDIFASFRATLWGAVDVEFMTDITKKLQKEVKTLPRALHKWDVHEGLTKALLSMSVSLPLVQDLRDESMRARHWTQLMQATGKTFVMDEKLQLDTLIRLELDKFQDPVTEIVERARAEIKIDLQLQKIITTWSGLSVEYAPFKATGVQILMQPVEVYEALDDNEVALQNMMGNRFMGFFEQTITEWKGKLGTVRSVLEVWLEVQRSWTQLESIFLASEDIREQLPEDAKRFDGIDAAFREQMADASQNTNPIEVCTASGREEVFQANFAALELCQKSLSDYLEVKKKKFPRFYFISGNDLVDILSKGRYPPSVQEHFSKFTDCTGSIDWAPDENGKLTGLARGCKANDGEKFHYAEPILCEGAVEDWLNDLMAHQINMFRNRTKESIDVFVEATRAEWLAQFTSQHCLAANQTAWTSECFGAFDRLEQGNENAMKEYYQVCVTGLTVYAQMVLGEMTKEHRTKVKTLITVDVHGRDIVLKMIKEKCENPGVFTWQSQLKFRWPENEDEGEKPDLYINICDAQFASCHEFVGNPGRLVITILTDRCYITLTQALRLMMGGAPQGPAGTGKTETTKDLGRGLAIWVIVSNCSDQMNNKVTGNFFSGLAQTGAWGCFDEFNRITVEVLSVVAGQYGSILEGIRAGKTRFNFEEEEINLVSSIGAWITMNPGYAGRAELPENLKALFRPCAMVVPNFENIAEVNLAGEGFVDSKMLANKFTAMYLVCKELLSKQMHYDWGLRAMSGVLRIAGGMKRADPDKSEAQILMRAMRDTNLPKFVQADFGIFLALINDLFPKLECPAVVNPELSAAIKHVITNPDEANWVTWGKYGRRPALQPEDAFVKKTVDLQEALSVRHSVFVLGTAGAAKSELWKTLAAAQTYLKVGGGKTQFDALNPKAVTSNELYGYVHPVTKEPYDGVIAKIMRDFAAQSNDQPKWMVLDGDIDAEWIESMNTVMDDNKILTLTTNERIPLSPSMRLLLEISHLRNASPATASRAGCVFLNETDVGWRPYVLTWVETMGDQKTQTLLEQLFEAYVAPTLTMMAKEKWVHLTPIKDIAIVEVICRILEGLLTPETCPPGSEKEVYEAYFQFAAVWGIGGAFGADKGADYRKMFDSYWRSEFAKSAMRFPDEGSIYEYFIDPTTKKGEPKRCAHWKTIIPSYTHERAEPYSGIFVPTMDSTRILFLSDMMLNLRKPVMLVGGSGSAKTVVLNTLLKSLDEDVWMYCPIAYNSFTISFDTQGMLEAPLEKKTGTIFGPPGTKKLIYFIDDFNMPAPDKYGTQSAIAILRQHKDYGGFYDLKTLRMKKLDNTQLVAAMNPTAGSFFIIDRMQRHFATFATPPPEGQVLSMMYTNIMQGHFEIFSEPIRALLPNLIACATEVHLKVADRFVPSAVKFHYQWNLRALAAVFQGLCSTSPATFKKPEQIARLYLHEATRVYSDRMVVLSDCEAFAEILTKAADTHFAEYEKDVIKAEPIVYATFVEEAEGDQKLYLPLEGYEHLSKILTKQLALYNESFAIMNLVLFNQAMEHVSRISRIIDNPRGNAMLVGVGGSGKQSLTRLAAFIGGCEVFQIKLTSSYGVADFKEDLRAIYMKTGVKSIPTCFLFTDQHVFKEAALIFLNDILSLGYPPGLFAEEDKDTIRNGVRNDAKTAGVFDAPEALWDFFINRVRALLHLCICMSPVGDKMRNRCRKFPALTSCTAINWFFNWPSQALISVAQRFLGEVEMETDAIRDSVANHMAFVHESVGMAAEVYRASERREVYTTPKSYLELIALYKDELAINRGGLEVLKGRLEEGLIKLKDAQDQVADMQQRIAEETIFVEKKKKETDELIVVVGQESIVAEEEGAKAAIEEAEVGEIARGVAEFQASANKDLAAAEPAIQKAEAALGGLNKAALGELKNLASPPAAVLSVTAAVAYMLAPKGANLKKIDVTWGGAKKMMGDVAKFLETLQNYDKDNFPLESKAKVWEYTLTSKLPDGREVTQGFAGTAENPEFNFEYMKTKSSAAAGLCDWIVNICIYHDIYLDVAPKREKLAKAEAELAAANKKLASVRAHVQALNDKMADLTSQLETATTEKNELIANAEKTQKRANLANRLLNGLGGEGARWATEVASLDTKMKLLVGDVMLSSAFVAYIAPFSRAIRDELVKDKWTPDVIGRSIPLTEGFDPMNLLTDASRTAGWNAEGLPADPLSTQNASIICKCARFPLIIDPQLQAVVWIRGRETPNGLIATVPGAKGWLDKVIRSLEEGLPLLLENMKESIEAIIDNMVARAFVKKGLKLQVFLGDRATDVAVQKDAEGNPTEAPLFRVYMQSRLPNPHYIPEVQAQTTLVNFTVTEKGLEDQLLSTVVKHERNDLLIEQTELVQMQNGFTIKLKELGDNLLFLLATAEGDILANEELIVTLEETKETVTEINAKQKVASVKEVEIAKAFESYRPNANRGSLIYFLMNQLNIVDYMYQYSLAAFNDIFWKALGKTEPQESLGERVSALTESITHTLFRYVSSGLFERHRLTFSTQLSIKIAIQQGLIKMSEVNLLVQSPFDNSKENPVAAWLGDTNWQACVALSLNHEEFSNLPADLEGSWKRWKEWAEHPSPEIEQLPTDWKRLGGFQQLLIMRAIRPDRMTLALRMWVMTVLGNRYGDAVNFDLPVSFKDAGPAVPVFFLLSPGVDATAEVRALGKDPAKHMLGGETIFSEDSGLLITVSLGQGQEPVAEKALDQMYAEGGWAMLENIELVAGWLPKLEKKLESLEEGAHPLFRTFLSAMPQPVVPVPILQKSIKLTNEPPSGLKANLKRAYLNFTEAIWENSSKQSEFKAIIFALCFFHSVACERRKFGPMGWNRAYPYNPGDLKDSIAVANNYLEGGSTIPWDDLRYLFGEIFYGGHITDNYDRVLCSAFLLSYVRVELLEGNMQLFPGFVSPGGPLNYKGYFEYIDESLDRETPTAYGLHPNAEVNFMTNQANALFKAIGDMSPKGGGSGEGGMTISEKVKQLLDDILEKLPEQFNMVELAERIEDVTPYTGVFLQEIERMNNLIFEMRRSLIELDSGLKGDLSITEPMEIMMNAMATNQQPPKWEKLAWASRASLSLWLIDMLARYNQLLSWTGDLAQPKVSWISGFFNAQAFVTAVMQVACRKNDWPLNRVITTVDVTKKMTPEEVEGTSRDGAYVFGLYMEGARWDVAAGCIEDAFMKELYPKMPVIQMRAILADKEDTRGIYRCPVYKQTERATPGYHTPGSGYLFMMQLKTKQPDSKWVMAGVAMLAALD